MRIKTKEELLASGWTFDGKDMHHEKFKRYITIDKLGMRIIELNDKHIPSILQGGIKWKLHPSSVVGNEEIILKLLKKVDALGD